MKDKKNNKGFSLLEILAAITIIGVITGISVVSYNSIQDTVLETSLSNLIVKIETAASEYTFNTSISPVSVETLVETGYLDADDTGVVVNPVDNSSLNCELVYIDYVDGQYVSTFSIMGDDYLTSSSGACEDYEVVEVSELEIVCTDGTCSKISGNNSNWYTGSVELTLEDDTTIDTDSVSLYKWSNTNGYYKESSEFENLTITTESLLSTTYTLSVVTTSGEIIKNSITVNIDNQAPTYTGVSVSDAWSNENKTVTVNASDGYGIGVEYYYIYSSSENVDCQTKISGAIDTEEYDNQAELANGTYSVCMMDYMGNISETYSFEVQNVDQSGPTSTGTFTFGNYETNNDYYSVLERKITFTDLDSGVSTINYCISTNITNTADTTCTPDTTLSVTKDNTVEAVIEFTESNGSKQYVCVQAVDSVGNESTIYCDETGFIYDNTNPIISISNTDNSNEIEISAYDNESQISSYTCNYGTSSSSVTSVGKIVSDNGGVYCQIEDMVPNKTYYVKVTVNNGVGLSTTSSTINFDSEVTIEQLYEAKCGDTEYCSDVIFLSYDGVKFGIYRNVDEGYKALYQGTLIQQYYSNSSGSCCDGATCTESNSRFDFSKVSSLVTSYVTSLSNYKNTLVNYTGFCVSAVNIGICSTTYTAYGALLDYNEYQEVKNTTTLFSHDTQPSSYSYVYLLNRASYSASGSVYGYYFSNVTSVANNVTHGMIKYVVVFNKDVTISSGTGTYSNPYVVEV